ncbi:MAG TPA: hypothetical protein PK208_09080 [Fibrobacteria bacterium]|nr:hypothetical protein [Fibrobacteria bacterium]
MPSFRILFASLCGIAAIADALPAEQFDWFSIATPGQAGLHRSDAGLPGQDEDRSLLVDLAANGGSYTGLTISYQRDHSPFESPRWTRPLVDFGIESAIEALPGLVFGLDATDHHPKSTASTPAGEWQLFDPQGGLRLGAGVDILRKWRADGRLRWIVAGWLPTFTHTREWELRTGFVWARRLRLDASAAWSDPAIPARWEIQGDSVATQDTVWWRADRFRWTIRIGGAPAKGASLQAWAGRRKLSDPGAGDEPSWRTRGEAAFAGAQGTLRTGPVDWDLEARLEEGSQSLLFDGSDTFGSWPDSGKTRSEADYSIGSARIKASTKLTESVRPALRAEAAWMDLENASSSGEPLPPVPKGSGTWSTAKRFSAHLEPSIRTRWVDATPSVGLQLKIRRGHATPVWQGLAPIHPGRVWTIPVGLRLSRNGSMNGSVGYSVSGEFPASGRGAPAAGLRHHVEMKQGF